MDKKLKDIFKNKTIIGLILLLAGFLLDASLLLTLFLVNYPTFVSKKNNNGYCY